MTQRDCAALNPRVQEWLDAIHAEEVDMQRERELAVRDVPRTTGIFASCAEADALLAAYERDRCPCGGSPAWVPEREQMHRVGCDALR